MSGPGEIEPWADALDEVDPREMAMGRFRARQEILAEVFGPENISASRRSAVAWSQIAHVSQEDIPLGNWDPWAGLGMDGETLEAKVVCMQRISCITR